jgi:hypothetical protein
METCAGYPLVLLAQHLKHLVTLKLSSWTFQMRVLGSCLNFGSQWYQICVYIIATSSHSFERLTQIIERVTWLTASWVQSSIAHRTWPNCLSSTTVKQPVD